MSSSMDSGQISWFRQRLAWLLGGASHNGKRNYDEDFGYPGSVTPLDLMRIYRRNGIASRIIRAYPQATFEEMPTIRDEAGDSAEEKKANGRANPSFSPFVKSVYDFLDRTQAMRYLERFDRMQSIGRFGVLVMGFRDNNALTTPLRNGKAELIYLQAYGEPSVEIVRYETDTKNPRYGLPLMYRIQPGKYGTEGTTAPRAAQFEVHYSRVLHAAEFLDDSEVLGTPRLEPVYNHLLDLQKILGSGAETFWRLSNPGIAFTADSDAQMDKEILDAMKGQIDEFENGMRRYLALQGLTPNTLGPGNQIADPSPAVGALLDVISGATGIPKRILTGSERGELASSQDADTWASRIDERQNNFATPQIILPFVNKMIETGNIAKPQGVVTVVWPESGALSPKDQAEVGRIRSETLAKYAASPNAELIVPPQEFRRDFLQLEPESEFEIEEPEDLPEEEEDEQIEGEDEIPEGEIVDEPKQIASNVGRILRKAGGYTIRGNRLHINAAPRTLYVRRDLLNAEEVRKHFKAQGLSSMVEAAKMHVTIAFSRTPVDWFKMGEAWTDDADGRLVVSKGGPRMLDLLGANKEVLVLLFACQRLTWRNQDMRDMGASWDYPDYNPHVSLSFDLPEERIDRMTLVDQMTPYQGELIFGPEIFEEVKVDWSKTIKENVRV